jgi:hypothetical protein
METPMRCGIAGGKEMTDFVPHQGIWRQ